MPPLALVRVAKRRPLRLKMRTKDVLVGGTWSMVSRAPEPATKGFG